MSHALEGVNVCASSQLLYSTRKEDIKIRKTVSYSEAKLLIFCIFCLVSEKKRRENNS